MAISIADVSGSPPCPYFLMPDLRKASPVKQSLFHRFGFRKWLARDDRASQFDFPGTNPAARDVKNYSSGNFSGGKYATNYADIFPPTDFDVSLSHPSTLKRRNSFCRDKPATSYRLGHRRAASLDRGSALSVHRTGSLSPFPARLSAPDLPWDDGKSDSATDAVRSCPTDRSGSGSLTNSEGGDGFDDALERQLDKVWILNLSMRFRDKANREKFFVTYAEAPNRLRKLTITCDYTDAEPGSLEEDLSKLQYHRDKSAQIYESICDSISQIEFFDTVTNLRLETRDGQLHVHVTEDLNELITYPPLMSVDYLDPIYIPESEIELESHLSGFVYRVRYQGREFVKKDITGPDTIEEFLYEINALHALTESNGVIDFKAIVVDDTRTVVKGLLIEDAEKGSLADIFYDFKGTLAWERRERWAKQIIGGLADIHEAGFVQGDFTVSNVVVDENDDARIIDINRRGCPIGWEPPEFIPKLDSKQRISMFIGVKSDIFQLGMTLWAIAMEDDEPGRQLRPLNIPQDMNVPDYYRDIVRICMSEKPRDRLSAKDLLKLFPREEDITLANLGDGAPNSGGCDHATEPWRYRSVNGDLQHTNSMLLENQGHGNQFGSLPNSLSSFDHCVLEQQAPVPSPVPGPPSENDTNPNFVQSQPYETIPPHEYILVDPYSLDQGHPAHIEEEYPRELASGPLLPLEQGQAERDTTTVHSDAPIFEAQHPEVKLTSPTIGLPSENTEHYSVEEYGAPQLLAGVGSHPLCALNSRYMTTGESLTKADTHSVSDILYHISSKNSEPDDYSVEDTQSDMCEGGRGISNFVTPPMDLLSSTPPINSVHEPLDQFRFDISCGGISDYANTHLPQASGPSVTSDICSIHELLASRLPINPANISSGEYPCDNVKIGDGFHLYHMHTAPNPYNLSTTPNACDFGDLTTSNLPINPAFKPLEESRRTAQLGDDNWKACLSLASTAPIPPNTQDIDDLLTSSLPINPAHQALEKHGHNVSGSSLGDRHTHHLTTVSSPSIIPKTCNIDDLLTSNLPINPTHRALDKPGHSFSEPNLGDGHIHRLAPISNPSTIPKTCNIDDLFASILPINPASMLSEDPVPEFSTRNAASFRKMRSSMSLGKAYAPAIISEEDLFLSELPMNPACSHSQDLEFISEDEPDYPPVVHSSMISPRPLSIENIFMSKLPINPSSKNGTITPILPTGMDLLSSHLPMNPLFNPLPPRLAPQRAFRPFQIFSGIDDLLTSSLPLNPRSPSIRFSEAQRTVPGAHDLFSSRLPINPSLKPRSAVASSAFTHNRNTPTSTPSSSTFSTSGLLTSNLPINPAFPAYNDSFIPLRSRTQLLK